MGLWEAALIRIVLLGHKGKELLQPLNAQLSDVEKDVCQNKQVFLPIKVHTWDPKTYSAVLYVQM